MRRIRTAYGECARSGDRVALTDLVRDGQTGMLVRSSWFEPRHPSEEMVELGPEEHSMPAPEISKPTDEGTAAKVMTFPGGKLTFV